MDKDNICMICGEEMEKLKNGISRCKCGYTEDSY